MVWLRDRQSTTNIQPQVEQILAAGKISRQEYLQLTTLMLSDYSITDEDRRQLNRIFDDVQASKIKLI